jgi:hypothetical protein
MKVRVTTRGGEMLEYEVDPDSVGRLEFKVLGQDPEFPARHWLHELASIEISEHPAPVTLAPAEPPRYEEREIDITPRAFVDGKLVPVGKPRTFTTRVYVPPKAPAKKKAAS